MKTVELYTRVRRAVLVEGMKRRAAFEPSIGHLKNEHQLERNWLRGTYGDAINAVLSAAAMDFNKLLGAFRLNFLCALRAFWSQFQQLDASLEPQAQYKPI